MKKIIKDDLIIKEIHLEELNTMIDSYIQYFNQNEMMTWNQETVTKKFRQLVLREDYVGLGLYNKQTLIGFAVGALIQFDDGIIAHLNEIFVDGTYQSKGLGSKLLKSFEDLVKSKGAFRIQLETTKDEIHQRFYNHYHDYLDTNTHLIKGKQLK